MRALREAGWGFVAACLITAVLLAWWSFAYLSKPVPYYLYTCHPNKHGSLDCMRN